MLKYSYMENPLSKVLTNAPPPPPAEVKIRTMRSDIESMMRSGGGAPTFHDVAVSGLSIEKSRAAAPVVERTPMPAPASYSIPAAPVAERPLAAAPVPVAAASQPADGPTAGPSAPSQEFVPEAAPEGSHLLPILIVTLVAILAIGVVAYVAFTLFGK